MIVSAANHAGAHCEARRLPSALVGPVLFSALRRLASICLNRGAHIDDADRVKVKSVTNPVLPVNAKGIEANPGPATGVSFDAPPLKFRGRVQILSHIAQAMAPVCMTCGW